MKSNDLSKEVSKVNVKFTEEHKQQFSSCNDFYDKMQRIGGSSKEGFVGDTPTISNTNKETDIFCVTNRFLVM
ncbi:MAG: hypothetical protein J6A33_00225 [Alphaproteobacteria bacterium]|nr:hypothetical protein [Alphaproteobacteria bacterium]